MPCVGKGVLGGERGVKGCQGVSKPLTNINLSPLTPNDTPPPPPPLSRNILCKKERNRGNQERNCVQIKKDCVQNQKCVCKKH